MFYLPGFTSFWRNICVQKTALLFQESYFSDIKTSFCGVIEEQVKK